MKNGIIAAASALAGAGAGVFALGRVLNQDIEKKEEAYHKMLGFYQLLNQWLQLKQEGKALTAFFRDHDFHSAAIYGVRELGERLFDELKDSEIEVRYAIDRNPGQALPSLKTVPPEGELEEVDVIVVTAIHYFDEIEQQLRQKVRGPIISLEDIIYNM